MTIKGYIGEWWYRRKGEVKAEDIYRLYLTLRHKYGKRKRNKRKRT